MDVIDLEMDGDQIRVLGFPEATALVALSDKEAKRLADLALHGHDMGFALECLDTINAAPNPVIKEALWRCAIVHYMKCFGQDTSRRTSLDADVILANAPEAARLAHKFFKDLRNKHIVHDENAYLQCPTAAVVNGPTSAIKIAKIITLTHRWDVASQENYNNLHLLINRSLAWVTASYDLLANQISQKLEAMSHEEIMALGPLKVRTPGVADIGKRR